MLFKIRNGPGTKTGTSVVIDIGCDRLVGSTFRHFKINRASGRIYRHMYGLILSSLCVTQEINTWANVYGYNTLNFTFTKVTKTLT